MTFSYITQHFPWPGWQWTLCGNPNVFVDLSFKYERPYLVLNLNLISIWHVNLPHSKHNSPICFLNAPYTCMVRLITKRLKAFIFHAGEWVFVNTFVSATQQLAKLSRSLLHLDTPTTILPKGSQKLFHNYAKSLDSVGSPLINADLYRKMAWSSIHVRINVLSPSSRVANPMWWCPTQT